MRRFGAAAALAVMIGASLFWRSETAAVPADSRRQELQCFAESVLRQTKPGDTVLFVVPSAHDDGGLTNHRLRYLMPGRFVRTNLDRGTAPERHAVDIVATWRSGCAGTIEKVRP